MLANTHTLPHFSPPFPTRGNGILSQTDSNFSTNDTKTVSILRQQIQVAVSLPSDSKQCESGG
jgi:hypothetical protein